MATVSDIVTRAFRRARVLSKDESLEAEDIALGVELFNSMLHGWKGEGVDVTHADQAPTDTFALDDQWQEATVLLLAQVIADEYGVPKPDPSQADRWLRLLQSNYDTKTESTFDTTLLRLPSRSLTSWGFR